MDAFIFKSNGQRVVSIRILFIRLWFRIHDTALRPVKFRIAHYLNAKYPESFCWADLVSYAMNTDAFNPFKRESPKGCEIESKENEFCYCGKFRNGECKK